MGQQDKAFSTYLYLTQLLKILPPKNKNIKGNFQHQVEFILNDNNRPKITGLE